jgi:hypothetical protein
MLLIWCIFKGFERILDRTKIDHKKGSGGDGWVGSRIPRMGFLGQILRLIKEQRKDTRGIVKTVEKI